MARKKTKVRTSNNNTNSSGAQSSKKPAAKPPPPTPAQPPKPRALPARTISLHNVPPTVSIDAIVALIPTIPISAQNRSVDATTNEPSSIVFLLFATNEEAVRAFFGLDGSVMEDEIVRTSWVNGVRF